MPTTAEYIAAVVANARANDRTPAQVAGATRAQVFAVCGERPTAEGKNPPGFRWRAIRRHASHIIAEDRRTRRQNILLTKILAKVQELTEATGCTADLDREAGTVTLHLPGALLEKY
jgi:hypothetical protein